MCLIEVKILALVKASSEIIKIVTTLEAFFIFIIYLSNRKTFSNGGVADLEVDFLAHKVIALA